MHLASSMIVKLAFCSLSEEARVAGFIFPQPVTMVGVPDEYLMLLSAGKHIGLVDTEKFTGSANSMIAKSLVANWRAGSTNNSGWGITFFTVNDFAVLNLCDPRRTSLMLPPTQCPAVRTWSRDIRVAPQLTLEGPPSTTCQGNSCSPASVPPITKGSIASLPLSPH